MMKWTDRRMSDDKLIASAKFVALAIQIGGGYDHAANIILELVERLKEATTRDLKGRNVTITTTEEGTCLMTLEDNQR